MAVNRHHDLLSLILKIKAMQTKLSDKLAGLLMDLFIMFKLLTADNYEEFCKNLPKHRKLVELLVFAFLIMFLGTLLAGVIFMIIDTVNYIHMHPITTVKISGFN